jgi:ubiquinone/menaquinone biosynthesis C-methylase UbiE
MCTSFLMATIYDRFMQAGEDACVGAWRQELLDEAHGRVLEIGAGTGLNLPRYGASVSQIVLCEPDANMRRKLEDRLLAVRPSVPVEIVGAAAERLPFADGSFDTVVSTLVLCSVQDPARTLHEVRRVLRPGGRLIFLEHVADDDPDREAWQRRIEPVWKRVAGNCHLRRRTCVSMREAGFRFERLERERMTKALPFVRSTIRGLAVVDAITTHLRVAEMP